MSGIPYKEVTVVSEEEGFVVRPSGVYSAFTLEDGDVITASPYVPFGSPVAPVALTIGSTFDADLSGWAVITLSSPSTITWVSTDTHGTTEAGVAAFHLVLSGAPFASGTAQLDTTDTVPWGAGKLEMVVHSAYLPGVQTITRNVLIQTDQNAGADRLQLGVYNNLFLVTVYNTSGSAAASITASSTNNVYMWAKAVLDFDTEVVELYTSTDGVSWTLQSSASLAGVTFVPRLTNLSIQVTGLAFNGAGRAYDVNFDQVTLTQVG